MSVKSKSSLFRNLLYLREVIACKQISLAANNNGIKASNLSKIISDTENMAQKKLFLRNNHGLTPTTDAIKLASEINELETRLNHIKSTYFTSQNLFEIKLYKPENLHLKHLQDYSRTLNITLCSCADNADIIISYSEPLNYENLIVVKNQIGDKIVQNIWVSAVNVPQVINLAEKIISDLHN